MNDSSVDPLWLETLTVYFPASSFVISRMKMIRNSSKRVILILALSFNSSPFLKIFTVKGISPDHLTLILVLSPSGRCSSLGMYSILGGAPTLTLQLVLTYPIELKAWQEYSPSSISQISSMIIMKSELWSFFFSSNLTLPACSVTSLPFLNHLYPGFGFPLTSVSR